VDVEIKGPALFASVTPAFAQAEGDGHRSIEHWRGDTLRLPG
jgi:uncharacterized protein YhfF